MAPTGGTPATTARGGSGMEGTRDRPPDRQPAWCYYAKAGQALTEFVLVLPFLILIFMGVLDLGRAFHDHVAVSNAARVGVIYAQQVYDPARQAYDPTRCPNAPSSCPMTITVPDVITRAVAAPQAGID